MQDHIVKSATVVNPRHPQDQFQQVGDVARSLVKRTILRGYAHGALDVKQTQSLINKLKLNEA